MSGPRNETVSGPCKGDRKDKTRVRNKQRRVRDGPESNYVSNMVLESMVQIHGSEQFGEGKQWRNPEPKQWGKER